MAIRCNIILYTIRTFLLLFKIDFHSKQKRITVKI
jgi:hypothetical protein